MTSEAQWATGAPQRLEWVTSPRQHEEQADAVALRPDSSRILLNAGCRARLVTGPRAQEHATLIAFLADYSPLDWPIAVRLVNQGIHSAYQLRRTSVRTLVNMVPEAEGLAASAPWSLLLKCALGTRSNLQDPRYLASQWKLYAKDVLHNLDLPYDILFRHLQRAGLDDIHRLRNLNPEQLGPLQMSHPAKLAALTLRRIVSAILDELHRRNPPDMEIRPLMSALQPGQSLGESIQLSVYVQDRVDCAVSPPFPPELWAIEALARGYKLNAWFMAQAIQDVFEESSRLQKLSTMHPYSLRRPFAVRAEEAGLGFLAEITILDSVAPPRAEALPGPRSLVAQVSETRKRARTNKHPTGLVHSEPPGALSTAQAAHRAENDTMALRTRTPPSSQWGDALGNWSFSAITRTVVLNLQRMWKCNDAKLFTNTCSVCGLNISPNTQSPWRLEGSQLPSDVYLVAGQLLTGSDIQHYSAHPECATQLALCKPGVPPARAWDLVSQEAQALRREMRPPLDSLLRPREDKSGRTPETSDPKHLQEKGWILREASIRTQLASVKGSWRSVVSGIRCWAAFSDEFRGSSPHFPASETDVEHYAQFFQNGGTLGNYLAHLEFAHLLAKEEYSIHPGLLRRLRQGRNKLTVHLTKPAIRHDVKLKLVRHFTNSARFWGGQRELAALRGQQEDNSEEHMYWELAAICSAAYDRLFRVPSELLPLESRLNVPEEPLNTLWHSAIIWEWTTPYLCPLRAHIHLRRRKNTPLPSTLEMHCKCQGEDYPYPPTSSSKKKILRWPDYPCALCRIFDLWQHARDENRPKVFTIKAAKLHSHLRTAAAHLNLTNGNRLSSHAFRRGATQDMVNSGTALSTILRLGGWRSAAVLHYMAIDDLENRNYALKASEDSDSS